MFQGEDIAFNGLEVCSYRHLQGMAKGMGLPSNVKKVHLIEMIRAKKYCTESDLQTIVGRVKMERKVNAQAKKKLQRKPYGLQGAEISSSSQSPPIIANPRSPSDFIIQYSPDISQTIMKYQPKQNLLSKVLQPLKRHIESDRVLRSFNSAKRPNYRIMEQNDCLDLVACSSMQEIQEVSQERAYQSVNVTVQKQRPVVTATVLMNHDRQLVPVNRSSNITKPAKRQRKLSGIYPLQSQDNPVYEYVPTVGFRQNDGRVTKINAVIQKPLASTLLPKNRAIKISKKSLMPRNQMVAKQLQNQGIIPKRRTLTVQDMINYRVDHQSIDVTKDRSNLYQIDCQTNETDRRERWIDDRANNSEVSYASPSELYSIPARNIDVNSSRKVYKSQKGKTAKQWSYSIESQDNETATKKQWDIYDINGQSLDQTDKKKIIEKETSEPVSTNYRVTQGRITDPISRDYQVEYQKFNQEIADRSVKTTGCFDQDRNIDPRSNMKEGHIQTLDKNYRSDRLSNPAVNIDNVGMDQITANKVSNTCTRDQYNVADRMCNDQRFDQDRIDQSRTITDNRYEIENKIFIDNKIQENTNECYSIDRHRSLPIDTNTDQQLSDQRLSEHRLSDQRLSDPSIARSEDISSQYPNMSALSDVLPNDYSQSNYSVYYHKKIRAEHVKCQKVKETLPRIADVFSQFNDVQYRSLTQPLYVHVGPESERVPTKQQVNISNTCMLETIYNFKNQFVTNPPVLLIATTITHCTYSTKTISSVIAQPSAAEFSNNTYERVNPHQRDCTSRVCDYLKPQFGLTPTPDFTCVEVLSSSTTSLDTTNSQDLGANVTIPEMVEDALELISQDGDYMERIGMDVRVQCMVCDWAGPKIIVEHHIKKEHSAVIQQSIGTDCTVICPVASLTSTWRGQLVKHGSSLYVLSGQWTGCTVLLALSMIPTENEFETKRARLTVYNKITGQPFSYESEIKELPDSMPYEYGLDCLVIDITKLNLIPSANSRLANRELVSSPEVKTELNHVEIIVYVKFLD